MHKWQKDKKLVIKLLPLSEMSIEDVADLFKSETPSWVFDHEAPEFTFHLVTGVGKTRLIGAIMAYPYTSCCHLVLGKCVSAMRLFHFYNC